MKKQKVVLGVVVASLVVLMMGASVLLYAPETSSAQAAFGIHAQSSGTLDRGRDEPQGLQSSQRVQAQTPLAEASAMQLPNGAVIALVMQVKQDKVHAFNALTGEWNTLEGPDFKVEGDDVAYVSNMVGLVVQNGQDQLHAYSALQGEWATLVADGFRVSADDIIKIDDAVIVVSQPGNEQIHAYSAITGQWATLSGEGFNVMPDDVVLVGGGN